MTEDVKNLDQELYFKWVEDKSKPNLSKLVKQLYPIIYSEVRRQSGTLPEAALSGEAKKWAIKAIQTYDPSKGALLSTHTVNYLAKTRRLNYKYQNAVRLPENLHRQFSEFRNVVSHLTDNLNRDPTDDEIADEIGWSRPQVVKFKGGLYDDLLESGSLKPTEATQFNSNKFLLDHILSQLDSQEKFILNNRGTMNSTQLAEALGVNVSRLNYLVMKLTNKVAATKKEIGMY
jgi:DNA-directed RNA polymerase specialized sigma subunit